MKQKHFRRHKHFVKLCWLICLNFTAAGAAFSQHVDPKLAELRNQFAVNYLKPEAHFALAKYHLDKGNKHQAFFIMEYARRYRFSREDFDAAFRKFFGESYGESSGEAKETFEKAHELLKQQKLDEAERFFVKAANLAPESAFIQSWVGRFFLKAKSDGARALPFYFKAYFLDPHAYDTEYAESRIRSISSADADAKFAELTKSGKSLAEISNDPNPLIVMRAIEQMAKGWSKKYIKPLFNAMSNDDSIVRWAAFMTLFQNADASFDEMLTALLSDKDLRKRGLAAYALVDHRKKKRFEILKKMLESEAVLIRFDALSALALKGGAEGLEILKQHRKVETDARLNELIDSTLKKK